jgi:hypothetical protein
VECHQWCNLRKIFFEDSINSSHLLPTINKVLTRLSEQDARSFESNTNKKYLFSQVHTVFERIDEIATFAATFAAAVAASVSSYRSVCV